MQIEMFQTNLDKNNENSIDINEKRVKLINKFDESKWLSILGPWINGPDHTNVFNYLVNQLNEGKRFTPKYGDIFNAFMHCEPGDVKVVIIGQDPYPQAGVADGIAFSCSKKGKAEASLRYIFSTLYQNIHSADPDLSRWSKQGVILLNTAFTTQVQAVGAHYEIWKPFTSYLLTEINKLSNKLAVVYMGRKAQQYEKYFPGQYNIHLPHPASAAYRGGKWEHNDCWNSINEHLESVNKPLINWV